MTLSFGTDGVRGDTRRDLTGDLVASLGRAAAEVLGADRFAVGRDPRASGPGLVEAMRSGVAAAGGAAVDLGVVPTPAVARWCDDEEVAGAVVSASHNAWHDNGVKLFASGGRKLGDDAQRRIESRLAELGGGGTAGGDAQRRIESRLAELGGGGTAGGDAQRRIESRLAELGGDCERGESADATGRAGDAAAGDLARRRHSQAVVDSIEGRDLAGLRIVVDSANGAASAYGPECLRRLGAEVESIHAAPDGCNINAGCGSLHPESLQAAVVETGADAGVAFDGDADRVVAVDHRGTLIDGDRILAVCAIDWARRGRLPGSAVVVTVMANLGLRRAMDAHGIAVVDTAVGDRHVLGALEERGLVLGGEQSGHLIFRDLATTGDGLLTAVQLLDVVKRSGRPLAGLAAAAMTRLPQVLVGVPVTQMGRPDELDAVLGPIAAAASERLGDSGRVLVRPSGTEPVVRVMVEAGDEHTARVEAERLSASVAEALSCG